MKRDFSRGEKPSHSGIEKVLIGGLVAGAGIAAITSGTNALEEKKQSYAYSVRMCDRLTDSLETASKKPLRLHYNNVECVWATERYIPYSIKPANTSKDTTRNQ
jgi:hypothetical protein